MSSTTRRHVPTRAHRAGAGLAGAALALAGALAPSAHGAWVDVRVNQDTDDARELVFNGTSFNSTNLGTNLLFTNAGGSLVAHTGLRFVDVALRAGTPVAGAPVLLDAFVDQMAANSTASPLAVTITGESGSVAPATFSAAAGDITTRPDTAAAVVWDPVDPVTGGARFRTPDLSAIVSELIGQPGWDAATSNAMVFKQVTSPPPPGPGFRTLLARESGANNAAILRIHVDGTRTPPPATSCYVAADNDDLLLQVTGLPPPPATVPAPSRVKIGKLPTAGATHGASTEALAYDPVEGDLYGSHLGRLGRIDRTTGEFLPLSFPYGTIDDGGNLVALDNVDSLAFEASGARLFAVHQTDVPETTGGPGSPSADVYLFRVDKQTGALVPATFDTDPDPAVTGDEVDFVKLTLANAGERLEDLAVDPLTNEVYAITKTATTGRLYRLQMTAGVTITWSLALVGAVTCPACAGAAPFDLEGLAFDADGNLYATTGQQDAAARRDSLYRLDKGNAQATQLLQMTEIGADPDFNGDGLLDTEGLVCRFAQVTEAAVGELRAYAGGARGAVVEWRTEWEQGTVGFDLVREDPATGERAKVNRTLLPALVHAPEGGRYRYRDPGAHAGDRLRYRLIELEASGRRVAHGPFEVTVRPRPAPARAGRSDHPVEGLERARGARAPCGASATAIVRVI